MASNKKADIKNWIKSSDYDIKTAEHMFSTRRYIYVLFMCHLSVEKLLKGFYQAALNKIPPKTHNLLFLSKEASLDVSEEHLKVLGALNDLSIATRYPEDIDELVKSFSRKRAKDYLTKTKDLLRWLKRDERLKI
jgi:HEPN domain-containing protein